MFYGRKRLLVLLIILGTLILGVVAYGIFFWQTVLVDQKNAEQRANVADYIFNECNWEVRGSDDTLHITELGYYTDDEKITYLDDTDGDFYPDVYEEVVGTNPFSPDVFDVDNPLTYSLECAGATLYLKGNPNMATTRFEVNKYNRVRNAGFGSLIYDVVEPDDISGIYHMKLTLPVITPEGQDISNAQINMIAPDGTLTPCSGGVVNADKETITLDIEEFGSYVVVFKDLLNDKLNNQPVVSLAIDDSGSMFYFNGEEDCNNDPDKLRYDFCQGVIDEIAKTSIIHMSYFTGSIVDGFDFNTSLADMTAKIKELKAMPEDERNFTGTALGSALANSLDKVMSVNNPNKFIVCLTDGISSEGYDLWDAKVESCAKSGVTLIVIGLGDDVDATKMAEDTAKTGGYYLNAKTADCIDTVSNSILAILRNRGVEQITIEDELGNETTQDVYLVADSGFSSERHGAPTASSGMYITSGEYNLLVENTSYGFASVARQLYLGTMPSVGSPLGAQKTKYIGIDGADFEQLSEDELSKIAIPLMGYSLSSTKTCSDAASFTDITVPALRSVEKYRESLISSVQNGYGISVTDGVLSLNDTNMPNVITAYPQLFYSEVVELGETQKFVSLDRKETYEFNKIAVYYPNMNALMSSSIKSPSDNYFLQAIFSENTSKQSARYIESDFNVRGIINADLLSSLVDRLQLGDPAVIAVDTSCRRVNSSTNYNMNAIALYRACDNSNMYYLKCYDSANPGKNYYYEIDTSNPYVYEFKDLWQGLKMTALGIVG